MTCPVLLLDPLHYFCAGVFDFSAVEGVGIFREVCIEMFEGVRPLLLLDVKIGEHQASGGHVRMHFQRVHKKHNTD